MEILTAYKKLKTLFTLLLLISLFSLQGISQQWTHIQDGNHYFESLQPAQNLSFYLFDDGYYSFRHTTVHQYGSPNAVPVHFSATPYNNGGDVDELVMNGTTHYAISPDIDLTETDNQITIKRSWELVQNKDNYYVITFENSQYTYPISGCIEFHYSKYESDIDPTKILDDYGNDWLYTREDDISEYQSEGFTDKYTWTFESLDIGEQRHFYINADCIPDPLATVTTRAVMKIEGTSNDCGVTVPYDPKGDGAEENIYDSNTYTLESRVKNFPHDPNCITADPYGLYTCDLNQTITYKIWFHNDGVDIVENVYLDMEIFAPYDDVKLIDASDHCDLTWNDNAIKIDFLLINLAGINSDPPPLTLTETYGFVELEVCYNLRDFTTENIECAEAIVDITFDSEAPITVQNTICRNIHCYINEDEEQYYAHIDPTHGCPSSPGQQSNYIHDPAHRSDNSDKVNADLVIFPNPSYDMIQLENVTIDENTIIAIYDISGQKVQGIGSFKYIGENKLDISNLNSGIYFISLITNAEKKTKRFVKI